MNPKEKCGNKNYSFIFKIGVVLLTAFLLSNVIFVISIICGPVGLRSYLVNSFWGYPFRRFINKNVIKVGQTYEFGQYAYGIDSKAPIKWQVIGFGKDHIVLITNDIIDVVPYDNDDSSSVSWSKSDLRQWMNTDFYESAFNEIEKGIIVKNETVTDYRNHNYTGMRTVDYSEDYVYILGMLNVKKYLNNDNRRSKLTPYALEKYNEMSLRSDCHVQYDTNVLLNSPIVWKDDEGNGVWWLLSPGYYDTAAAAVMPDGQVVNCSGNMDEPFIAATDKAVGVRPVIKVDVELFFQYISNQQQCYGYL